MDERCIGAVLEQAPDEIRKQVFVGTHGRVSAHWTQARNVRSHRLEHELAHSVQALELVLGFRRSHFQHSRHGERIVGGELGVDHVIGSEQPLRAHQVAGVGCRL